MVGQRGAHDEVVEHDHQQRDGGDEEGPESVGSWLRLFHGGCGLHLLVSGRCHRCGCGVRGRSGADRGRHWSSAMHPSRSMAAHPSVASRTSIDAMTLSSMPRPMKVARRDASTPRHGRDVLGDLAEAVLDGRPDIGVVTGRVRLHLHPELGAVPEHLAHMRRRSSGSRACRVSPPRPRRRNRSRVSSKQRRIAARNSSFLVPYSRNRYGCEMPTLRAMVSVDVPWRPVSANASMAACTIASRRSTAVRRCAAGSGMAVEPGSRVGAVVSMAAHVSDDSQPCQQGK